MTPTRGERNNNPGNIDRNTIKWFGMADDQSTDPRFIVFKEARWGIRAIGKLLITYNTKYKCQTVRQTINRWAPHNENNTGSYVQAVADECGVTPNQVLDFNHTGTLVSLIKAIIHHENGRCNYTDEEIRSAVALM